MKKVIVIGAGVAGISTALEISRKNYEVVLVDKYNPLKANTSFGKSFNYTINLRGKIALQKLGVWDKVKKVSKALEGRILHTKSNSIKQLYGVNNVSFLHSIPRNKLISILCQAISKQENIQIKFDTEIMNITYDNNSCNAFARNRNNKQEQVLSADFIVVADGVRSKTRNFFHQQLNWQEKIFHWGYREFKLTKETVKKNNLKLNYIHIWEADESLWVGIPNSDKTISLLYCAPTNYDFFTKAQEQYKDLFQAPLLPEGDESVSKLVAVKLEKWYIEDKIIFLGDSAHGIFPFYGQGMNAALEDSSNFINILEQFSYSREKAFNTFYLSRKPQTDILFEFSERHFNILKFKGRSLFYNAKNKIDIMLNRLFPSFWYHEYNMMSNTTVNIKKIAKHLKFQKLAWLFPPYWLLVFLMLGREFFLRLKARFF